MARISFRTEGYRCQLMVWKPGIKEILVCFIKGVQNKGIKVFCFKRADKIFWPGGVWGCGWRSIRKNGDVS